MKMSMIGLATLILYQFGQATTYGPSPTTKFFEEFKGDWKSEISENDRHRISITKANYILWYRGFQISHSEHDGMHDSGWIVQLIEQDQGEIHAIYLFGWGAHYFRGKIEEGSKKILFEALFPDLKQPNFLTIDFTKCPDSPPTAALSRTKPGVHKTE